MGVIKLQTTKDLEEKELSIKNTIMATKWYRVIQLVEIEGQTWGVGQELQLEEEVAKPLIKSGHLEAFGRDDEVGLTKAEVEPKTYFPKK